MKPTERAALDRQMLRYAGAPSIEEHYVRLQMRFPAPADAGWDHWTHVLISEGCAALGHDLLLLLSVLHPADAAALVSQRGKFKINEALGWIKSILVRHHGYGDVEEFFAPIEPQERIDDDETDDEVIIGRLQENIGYLSIDEMLDCDDCATWFRSAPREFAMLAYKTRGARRSGMRYISSLKRISQLRYGKLFTI